MVLPVAGTRDERGASAAEYGLMVALIAAVIVFAVISLGGVTEEMFADTCDEVRGGISATGNPPSSSC